jgi:RNA polymerase sigma factor (sigma-70 family)
MTTTTAPEAIKEILLVSAPPTTPARSLLREVSRMADLANMTQGQTNDLVELARGDNPSLATAARDLLIRRLLPVVNSAISRLDIKSATDREDARQAAMLRTLTCIERFDPGANMTLSSYVYGSAQKAAINWLQRERGDLSGSSETGRERPPARSLDAPARRVVDDDDDVIGLADVIADERCEDPAECAARSCQADSIRREVDRLPSLEREVIRMRFGIGGGGEHARAVVAERLHLSVSQVDAISSSAREMLLNDSALARMGELDAIHDKPPLSIDELATAALKDHHQAASLTIPLSTSIEWVIDEERRRHPEHIATLEAEHPDGLALHLEQICADRAAAIREQRIEHLQAGAAAHRSAALAMTLAPS